MLLQYNIAIIPLLNRIYGSVPSKIFEYARLGLPTIYFGGGEGENIIEKFNLGWVAKSGDYNELNMVISERNTQKINLEFQKKIQESSVKNFDFKLQLQLLIKKL